MTAMNRAMVFAGIITLFQAAGQVLFTTLALMQYFCVIDFLQELPILIFIRILYFHRPDYCGTAINIGQSIDGMTDQAFVLVNQEPFTVLRTFILNSVSLGLSFLWILACFGLMSGGAENKQSKPIRWPWIIITVIVCGVDLVATVTYANDSFHTRTLSDMMDYIGATVSGAGNLNVNTTWVAWAMVILYSRFVILFIINVFLIIVVVIYVSSKPGVETTSTVEAPAPRMSNQATTSTSDIDAHESPPSTTPTRIPRPGLSQSFQRMKDRLLNRQPSPVVARLEYSTNSLGPSPERSPKTQHAGLEKKRTVNFPENLLSLPQRLENLIAEQQRRLDKAVVDTGRRSPPRASQSLPHLESTSQDVRGRRGTATELQGQLPWAYIPASAHRMRDQLPPDEDLPPVPLPDYSAIPSFRKASVHRAASSLSSLTQKKDFKSQLPGPPLTQLDVLY